MATATVQATRPSAQSKPRPCSCRLTLAIGSTSYTVKPVAPGPDHRKAFRLRKVGSDLPYDVVLGRDGLVTCDCADAVWRHNGRGTMCKHGRALVACGLLPAPKGGAR